MRFAGIPFLVAIPSCVFQSEAHTAIRPSDAVQRATVQIREAAGNFARLLVWVTSLSTVEHLPELQRYRDPRNRLQTAHSRPLRGRDVHGNIRLSHIRVVPMFDQLQFEVFCAEFLFSILAPQSCPS